MIKLLHLIEFRVSVAYGSDGSSIYSLDEEGEEVDVLPYQKYRFKVRIDHIDINTDSTWDIRSEFIITTGKKIILPHIPVAE